MLCDIKVGDFIFDRHGNPTKVLGVYNQGKLDNYKVTFSDGRFTYCNDEHLWSYYDLHGRMHTKTLKELVDSGLYYDNLRVFKYKIPTSEPVKYSKKTFDIDPYVIGVFLGDGCCMERILTLSSKDEEIVAEISRLIGSKSYLKSNDNNYSWIFEAEDGYINKYNHKQNVKYIQTNDLFKNYPSITTKSYEKHIPDIYIYGSIEQRLSLLQGLFDTDGCITKNGGRYNIRFTTCSHQLALDVKTILLSLGYVSYLHIDKRQSKYTSNYCYELNVNIPNKEKYKLFRVTRKRQVAEEAKQHIQHRDYTKTSIVNVEKMKDKVEMLCLYVENDEHLYLTNDYIVTHNTTLVQYIIDELHIPENQVVYIAYTGKATLVLRNKGCKNAMTAHKLLYHSEELPDGTFVHTPKKKLDKPYSLIVCDEASMLPQEMIDLLLSHHVYVLFLGDNAQLPPIEGKQTILDNPDVFLAEVTRQALDNPIIKLSMDVREGKSLEYGGDKRCRVVPNSKITDALLLGADQIIVGKNITRHKINEYIRSLKWGEKYSVDPLDGEKCICLKNNWNKVGSNGDALVNGQIGYLTNIHIYEMYPYKKVINADFVSDDGGVYKDLLIDYNLMVNGKPTVNKDNWKEYAGAPKLFEFAYAYAITCHKSQGSEFNRVILFEEWLGDYEQHVKWLYTGITRAAKQLVVVK